MVSDVIMKSYRKDQKRQFEFMIRITTLEWFQTFGARHPLDRPAWQESVAWRPARQAFAWRPPLRRTDADLDITGSQDRKVRATIMIAARTTTRQAIGSLQWTR
jgi:hypothetical protein